MVRKLKENPSLKRLVARYDHLPRRDQQALKLMVAALVLALLYFAIWRPVDQYQDQARASRENAAELLAWMQENRIALRELSGKAGTTTSNASKPADGRELMATVTSTAREAGLSLQRFEPSGDDAIRVWMEDVPFSQVAAWLERLNNNHGIMIDQAAVDRRNTPGVVSVRLTLAI
ncbi:general secretion pathway protein M [Marinobacter daqiaonensis]|uniref:Type II secretion system protein M n=1 Tax=Marinobacter daqiaonensis TaxID=650891 RepID=A0A1I6GPN6_9GAMM|nr:type II secretion system protein M [Marinobacter daqiaonensis]SFR44069.1 general secretion pathway protein M [Marinobacter daqiaonensis]